MLSGNTCKTNKNRKLTIDRNLLSLGGKLLLTELILQPKKG